MKKSSIRKVQFLVIIVTLFANSAIAQVSHDNELFKILKAKDSLMFEVGFNQCNLEQVKELLPEKFEFYHDKDGIINSRTTFIKTLKENLCSSGKNTTMRILKEGSLEVFPLYQQGELYGAIQTGKHYFGNTVARFTNLWLIENGEWMPTKIISYDHKIKKASMSDDITFIKLSSDGLSIYLGDYKFSPEFVLSIVKEGEKIFGDAQGQKVEIKPFGKHMFLDEDQTMELNFIISNKGNVTGLIMKGPDGEMRAQKIN